MKFSIVIPVYGSEKILKRSYEEFSNAIKKVTDDYELLFRVDGSPDGSERLLIDIAASDPKVKIFAHTPNKGLGYTLRKLFEDATGEFVIYFDADSFLCFDLSALPSFAEKIKDADALVASRYMFNPLLPLHRWLASEAYYYLNRILFGVRIRDLGSGFVIFRKSALDSVTLVSNGFEIHAEVFVRLQRKGLRIVEVPLAYKHWDGGSFRFLRHGPKAIYHTLKLWLELR